MRPPLVWEEARCPMLWEDSERRGLERRAVLGCLRSDESWHSDSDMVSSWPPVSVLLLEEPLFRRFDLLLCLGVTALPLVTASSFLNFSSISISVSRLVLVDTCLEASCTVETLFRTVSNANS